MILLILVFGCSKQLSEDNFDVGMRITVEDKNGNSLLDPNHENYIDVNKINVYYMINNEMTLQFESHWDCPKKICLISENGERWLALGPNFSNMEEFPITYIEWPNGITDTIKCHFLRPGNSIICDKIWYNGNLVYPNEDIKHRGFKIIR